jgi:hypothetical protein
MAQLARVCQNRGETSASRQMTAFAFCVHIHRHPPPPSGHICDDRACCKAVSSLLDQIILEDAVRGEKSTS